MTDEETPGFKVVDRRAAEAAPGEESTASADTEAAAAGGAPDNDEASDEQAAGAGQPTDTEQSEPEMPGARDVPDPGFLLSLAAMQLSPREMLRSLLPLFDIYAWQGLGLIARPGEGEATRDLPAAQLAIDCVQFFYGKVEADLSDTERRELQRRLTDLRMNYLEKLREG